MNRSNRDKFSYESLKNFLNYFEYLEQTNNKGTKMSKPYQKLPKNNLTESQHQESGNVAVALMSRRKDGGTLTDEFEYYLENQQALADEYEGKVIVIKNKKVIGVYKTKRDALIETEKTHKLGSFLVQLCSRDPNSTKHSFHSRVRFLNAEPN